MLVSHTWDLEDKRICRLPYIVASGIHMLSIPVVSIVVSFTIAYMILGWQWESFWAVNLFCIMLTISSLQLGKAICAALKTFEAVSGCYSVYLYLGLVCSGLFVNPGAVPSYFRWAMYMSLSFWGISGAQLSQLEHVDIGEDQCLTLVSCILYDRNIFAQMTGYTYVTTAYQSIVVLSIIAILLILVEYYCIFQKVSQRTNYEVVESLAKSTMNDKEKHKDNDISVFVSHECNAHIDRHMTKTSDYISRKEPSNKIQGFDSFVDSPENLDIEMGTIDADGDL